MIVNSANPPIVLDASALSTLVTKVDPLQAMRQLFTQLGQGTAVQPPQTLTLFPQDRGDFITYMGASTDAQVFGAKLSPYLVGSDKAVVTAWTLLMCMQTGQPLLLCDAAELTTLRTAATTALAVTHLAPKGSQNLAIIGSGAIAQAHFQQVKDLHPWSNVAVYSPGLCSNVTMKDRWQRFDTRIRVAATAAEASADADVILLCTSSATPVIDASAVKPGALVTSISTNADKANEVAPSFLLQAEVYCDDRNTTPSAAGEMVLASALGWSANSVVGDLAGLQTSRCALPSGTKPVFFRSVGLGLEDIFMAHAIYKVATK